MLLILLASSLSFSTAADPPSCFTCASSGLRKNWGLTGLDYRPDNLIFTDECSTSKTLGAEVATTVECAGVCFEMAIPTGNMKWEFLRGCHKNFIEKQTEFTSPTVAIGQSKCHMFTFDNGVNAINFCQSAEDDSCNNKLRATATELSGTNTVNVKCDTLPEVQCVKCQSYDGKGKCSSGTAETAKGPLCIKIRGKYSGHDYEERAPSFILPSDTLKDFCVDPYYAGINAIIGPSVGSNITRAKRDVLQSFSGSKCYCTGTGKCNSSPMVAGLPATLLLLLTAVPFFS